MDHEHGRTICLRQKDMAARDDDRTCSVSRVKAMPRGWATLNPNLGSWDNKTIHNYVRHGAVTRPDDDPLQLPDTSLDHSGSEIGSCRRSLASPLSMIPPAACSAKIRAPFRLLKQQGEDEDHYGDEDEDQAGSEGRTVLILAEDLESVLSQLPVHAAARLRGAVGVTANSTATTAAAIDSDDMATRMNIEHVMKVWGERR